MSAKRLLRLRKIARLLANVRDNKYRIAMDCWNSWDKREDTAAANAYDKARTAWKESEYKLNLWITRHPESVAFAVAIK